MSYGDILNLIFYFIILPVENISGQILIGMLTVVSIFCVSFIIFKNYRFQMCPLHFMSKNAPPKKNLQSDYEFEFIPNFGNTYCELHSELRQMIT